MKKNLTILLLIFCSLLAKESIACSALFIKKGSYILGKNFDWYSGNGVIIKNNRGIKKTAYGIDTENVVNWTSKYGSITFNQIGKEFPYGGINERGLAVEMLWQSSANYEENGKASLSELEWIQYQLDNYKTAAEVAAYVDSININPINANLHFIVADRGGRSFIIEFINGKAVVSKSNEEYLALTNSLYNSSVKYYEKNAESINSKSRKSSDRYCQLASKANSSRAQTIDGMFDILSESAENREQYKTYWSIVYDLYNHRIFFKSNENNRVKTIEMYSLSFDSKSPNFAMDINTDFIHWQFHKAETNLALLSAALDQAKIKINLKSANRHMMQPEKFIMDDTYSKHHADLKIRFNLKKTKGLLFYTLIQGEENFKKYKGEESGILIASEKEVIAALYSIPKKEYAIASFHDLDRNFKMNTGLFGIPSEPTAFSNNSKRWFGRAPKYQKAKFNLDKNRTLDINIR